MVPRMRHSLHFEPVALVDAYNVMRSRWPNLAPDRFVEHARAWAGREGVRLVAVFDGKEPGGSVGEVLVDERSALVGTGSGSADDWIVREAERLAADGRVVWLISSDRLLRQRAAPFLERTIGGGAFAGELEAADD
jgi:YacP-like NYN domain